MTGRRMRQTIISGICLSVLLAAAQTYGAAGAHPSDPNVQDVLDELAERAAELQSYQADVDYVFKQTLLESQSRRKGVLYYARFDDRSYLRIDFDTLQQDQEKERKAREQYFFDGVWLTYIDHELKSVEQHQMAEPNEPIDAFKLVSQEVPVVGFSEIEDLENQFYIELLAPSSAERPSFHHLHMSVKPDSTYKNDYSAVEFWIDKNGGLPTRIVAVEAGEEDPELADIHEILLTDARINKGIGRKRLQRRYPRRFPRRKSPTQSRQGRPVSPTTPQCHRERGPLGMDSGHVPEQDFLRLVERRAGKLLELLHYFATCGAPREAMTRPFLGDLLSQATQVEEIFDAYDAGKNCRWCRMRALTAAVKAHADLSYELLHIRHRTPSYRLLPGERDFTGDTNQTLDFTGRILGQTAKEMTELAETMGIAIAPSDGIAESYAEPLLPGHLAHDCGARRVETVSETVALLATSFLNHASASEDIRAASRAKPDRLPPLPAFVAAGRASPQPRIPVSQPPISV